VVEVGLADTCTVGVIVALTVVATRVGVELEMVAGVLVAVRVSVGVLVEVTVGEAVPEG